jgi:Tfp pilus assembly protein FimT
LVELLVVILVIAIIMSMSVMQYGKSRERFRMQNVARELKVAFERARFDSVKRRPEDSSTFARVAIAGGTDEANTYTLTTDLNQNGTFDTGDSVTTNTSPQGILIKPKPGVTMSFPVTVAFNMRGEVVASQADGSAVLPSFIVCYQPCTPAESLIVLVTPTGTVNILDGVTGVPNFTAPGGFFSVNSNTNIYDIVTVPGPSPSVIPTATPDDSGSPTPTPTPTGSGTPTPDPNGSATPSPTGTTTPSPSPTGSASPTPTATGTPNGSPTATATPAGCYLTGQSSVSFAKNLGSGTFSITYNNATNNTISVSVTGDVTSAAPTSKTVNGSGSLDVTILYANGANKFGTIVFSGCGGKTVSFSTSN